MTKRERQEQPDRAASKGNGQTYSGCSTLFPPWSLDGLYIEILQRDQPPTSLGPVGSLGVFCFSLFRTSSGYLHTLPTSTQHTVLLVTAAVLCAPTVLTASCLERVLLELCICVYGFACTYHTFVGQIRVGNWDGWNSSLSGVWCIQACLYWTCVGG